MDEIGDPEARPFNLFNLIIHEIKKKYFGIFTSQTEKTGNVSFFSCVPFSYGRKLMKATRPM